MLGHVLFRSVDKTYSDCNSGNDVVLEYVFFQLCSNTEQIS